MSELLHVSFNQDSTCFVCGYENGFAVYNCDPLGKRFSRLQTAKSGIGIAEMLFRSNMFALVGGGTVPKYDKDKVMIWDDFKSKCIAELQFKDLVTGVRLQRDYILIITLNKTFLYTLEELKLEASFDSSPNLLGIAALTTKDKPMAALPGPDVGSVIIYNILLKKHHIISAHTNALAAIALSSDGMRLATASERGTLIRIWNTQDGTLVKEFRRGLEVVTITSLTFDLDTTRLAVCSGKGTIHIFSLIENSDYNRKSSFAYISDYLPSYFSSEWSSVSFEVPTNSICTFSTTSVDTIYVVTPDAKFLKYIYDVQTGVGNCENTFDIKLDTL